MLRPHHCASRPAGGQIVSHISNWPRRGDCATSNPVRYDPPAKKMFLTLVTGPGTANVLPYAIVCHGLAAEKNILELATGPGAAHVLPRTSVRHGLAAGKSCLALVTGPNAANWPPHTLVRHTAKRPQDRLSH